MASQLNEDIEFTTVIYDLDGVPRTDLDLDVAIQGPLGTTLISASAAPAGDSYRYVLDGSYVTTYGAYIAVFSHGDANTTPPVPISMEYVSRDPVLAVLEALTAQGYTEARAEYLDNMSAPPPVSEDPWETVVTSAYPVGSAGYNFLRILRHALYVTPKSVMAQFPYDPKTCVLTVYRGDERTVYFEDLETGLTGGTSVTLGVVLAGKDTTALAVATGAVVDDTTLSITFTTAFFTSLATNTSGGVALLGRDKYEYDVQLTVGGKSISPIRRSPFILKADIAR